MCWCCMSIETCGPNEALIISGVCYGKNPTIIVGGRAFVCSCFHKVQRIPLNTLTLVITSPLVYTKQGVAISVTGVAQAKINSSNDTMLRAAAEQFGSKSEEEITCVARETLEGHQRAIMGTMTVEEIYRDRKKFSKRVFDIASEDLIDMGIIIISYTISDVRDECGYLAALGASRTAEVQRDARIGEAKAYMEASIETAKAEEQRMKAKFSNDTEIARAKRDFDLKKATYDVEVNTAKAEAELAFKLQAATIEQKIKEQEQQVVVVERMKMIEIANQEVQRKEKQLESGIKQPAEAEKFRLETISEANKQRVILQAQASAEAVAIRGEADAFAIEAKGKAEAEQMTKKAEAREQYQEAAKIEMILHALPRVAAEISVPLSGTNKITMVSDSTGEIGAAKITKEVMDIMASVPDVINKMTGVDIAKKIRV